MLGPVPDPQYLIAGIVIGPEVGAYAAVGGMLALLFRLVFRTLAVKDTEVERHMRRLTMERDRAEAWQRWQSARADHWYAVALGDKDPPPIPPPPIDAPSGPELPMPMISPPS